MVLLQNFWAAPEFWIKTVLDSSSHSAASWVLDLSHLTLPFEPQFPHEMMIIMQPDQKIVVGHLAGCLVLGAAQETQTPFFPSPLTLSLSSFLRQVAYLHLPGILSSAAWLKRGRRGAFFNLEVSITCRGWDEVGWALSTAYFRMKMGRNWQMRTSELRRTPSCLRVKIWGEARGG